MFRYPSVASVKMTSFSAAARLMGGVFWRYIAFPNTGPCGALAGNPVRATYESFEVDNVTRGKVCNIDEG